MSRIDTEGARELARMWRVYSVAVTSRAITELANEIDRLRAEVAAFKHLAGCDSDCELDGPEIVHRPCCVRWEP